MDALKQYHDFATAVCAALNQAEVRAPDPEAVAAVMVIYGPPHTAPLGGALNFDDDTGQWTVETDVQEAERVEPEFAEGELDITLED